MGGHRKPLLKMHQDWLFAQLRSRPETTLKELQVLLAGCLRHQGVRGWGVQSVAVCRLKNVKLPARMSYAKFIYSQLPVDARKLDLAGRPASSGSLSAGRLAK